MSNPSDIATACPSAMTMVRAGSGTVPAPEDVASGPFRVQMLLSSGTEGEMTVRRASIDPGVVTHRA